MLPRRAQTSTGPGGTAVDSGSAPVVPIAIGAGAIVLIVIAYFVFRGGSTSAAPPPPPPPTPTAQQQTEAPTSDLRSAPLLPTETAAPRGPTPEAVASDLDRELKHQHLWSTVHAIGDRLEIRSSSCREPGMASAIAGATAAAKSAGLVRLRCLEESGTVVMDSAL